jgi:hypothetical protein
MKHQQTLLTSLIAVVAVVSISSSHADLLAGVDFQVGTSTVEPGFTGVTVGTGKTYSTTQNGITMEFVGTSSLANANRDRGGAIDAFPLLDDFTQLVGTTENLPQAAITFSGLTPNTDYIFTFYSHNQGAFQQFHTFYHGDIGTGTNLGSFKSSFNPSSVPPNPALAANAFQLSSGNSGVVLVTMLSVEGRLTINGFSVTALPPPPAPPTFNFTITPNATAWLFDFSWDSREGKVYDLLASTDLSTPVSSWPTYDDGTTVYENLPATGTRTTLTGVPSGVARRFFAMREEDAPPVPPLLSENFDDDNGSFTITKIAGTDWAWGDPDSTGTGGVVATGNGGAGKCWGTNIGNPGFYVDPTTDTRLQSPRIDLTSVAAAELSFAQVTDFPAGDTAVVRLINDDTDVEIVSGAFPLTVTDADISSANWQTVGPITLPVGAPVRIEWSFTGSGAATADYMGWYLDDVQVVEVAP